MKYHKQLNTHNKKVFGDCYRTAVACILDLNPLELPNNWEDQTDLMREYLNTIGYSIITMHYEGNNSLADILTWCGVNFNNMYYILCGLGSQDATVDHAVVCKGDKMIHDPHPSNTMIVAPGGNGFWSIEIIVRHL